jgi:hypothetical protein
VSYTAAEPMPEPTSVAEATPEPTPEPVREIRDGTDLTDMTDSKRSVFANQRKNDTWYWEYLSNSSKDFSIFQYTGNLRDASVMVFHLLSILFPFWV